MTERRELTDDEELKKALKEYYDARVVIFPSRIARYDTSVIDDLRDLTLAVRDACADAAHNAHGKRLSRVEDAVDAIAGEIRELPLAALISALAKKKKKGG